MSATSMITHVMRMIVSQETSLLTMMDMLGIMRFISVTKQLETFNSQIKEALVPVHFFLAVKWPTSKPTMAVIF